MSNDLKYLQQKSNLWSVEASLVFMLTLKYKKLTIPGVDKPSRPLLTFAKQNAEFILF